MYGLPPATYFYTSVDGEISTMAVFGTDIEIEVEWRKNQNRFRKLKAGLRKLEIGYKI